MRTIPPVITEKFPYINPHQDLERLVPNSQKFTWKGQIGQPYVTVSAKGLSNGLSNIPNDGADFGPDTLGTKTSGIQEAINGLEEVINPFSGRTVPSGKILLLNGRFNGTDTVTLYDDYFVEIEGVIPNILTNQSPGVSTKLLKGAPIIDMESAHGAISVLPNPVTQPNTDLNQLIGLKNINFIMSNNNIVDPYNYAIVGMGPDGVLDSTTTPNGDATIQPNLTMVYLENISIQDYGGTNPQLHCVSTGFDALISLDNIFIDGNSIPKSANASQGAANVALYGNNAYFGVFSITVNGVNVSIPNLGELCYVLHIITGKLRSMNWLHLFGNPNGYWRVDYPAGQQENLFMFKEVFFENTKAPSGAYANYAPFYNAAFQIGNLATVSGGSFNPLVYARTNSSFASNFPYIRKVNGGGTSETTGYASTKVFNFILGNNYYGLPTPTISTNPPTSGTVYQNTNLYDIRVYLPVYATTSGTSGSVDVAVGPISTPGKIFTQFIDGKTAKGTDFNVQFRVPAGYHYKVTGTSVTFETATVMAD